MVARELIGLLWWHISRDIEDWRYNYLFLSQLLHFMHSITHLCGHESFFFFFLFYIGTVWNLFSKIKMNRKKSIAIFLPNIKKITKWTHKIKKIENLSPIHKLWFESKNIFGSKRSYNLVAVYVRGGGGV